MAERPAVNRQVIGSSPIAGAPGGARRKRTGGPDRVPAPGCKKDGESGREHLAKALSWRRPAGPYRPRAHLRSRVAQWQSGRLLTGRLLVRVQSREQYEQGPFPAEGALCPPVAHHPQGPRSTRSTPLAPSRIGPVAQPARCRSPRGYDAGHGRTESHRTETAENETSIALWHLVGAGNGWRDRQGTPTLYLDESGGLQSPTGEERFDLGP